MEKRSKDTKNTTKNNKKKMSGMMAKIVTPVAAMALVTLVTVSGLRMAVQNLYNQGMMISEQIVSCVDAAGALDTDHRWILRCTRSGLWTYGQKHRSIQKIRKF